MSIARPPRHGVPNLVGVKVTIVYASLLQGDRKFQTDGARTNDNHVNIVAVAVAGG
jgi:hypothetical protein